MDKSTILKTLATRWAPAERRIFKPSATGNSGTMLKIQLRLNPKFSEDGGYVVSKETDGGLFLEIVPQAAERTQNGDATFDYNSDKRVIALIGTPDVTKLLVAFREVRMKGKPVPEEYRKKGADSPNSLVNLFHKSPGGGSCVISWDFQKAKSVVRLSRSANQRQQITLTLDEELLLVRMLERALDAYLDLGY